MKKNWWRISFIINFFIIEALVFRKIDSASHSVSDTLINFVPSTLITALILFVLYTSIGDYS